MPFHSPHEPAGENNRLPDCLNGVSTPTQVRNHSLSIFRLPSNSLGLLRAPWWHLAAYQPLLARQTWSSPARRGARWLERSTGSFSVLNACPCSWERCEASSIVTGFFVLPSMWILASKSDLRTVAGRSLGHHISRPRQPFCLMIICMCS